MMQCTPQGSDQSVRLWDPRSNQCVQKFSNLGATINSVVFFPSGDFVAAAVDDGTVSQRSVCVHVDGYDPSLGSFD